jgi:hypothetical protein
MCTFKFKYDKSQAGQLRGAKLSKNSLYVLLSNCSKYMFLVIEFNNPLPREYLRQLVACYSTSLVVLLFL